MWQSVTKIKSLLFILTGLVVVGVVQQFKTGALEGAAYSASVIGKGMSSYKVESSFSWIDRQNGIGRVSVRLKETDFSQSKIRLSCSLPDKAKANSALEKEMSKSSVDSAKFEFEVIGLDSSVNQNIICQLRPMGSDTGALAVVIPSNYEKTQEYEIAKQYSQQEPSMSLKSLRVDKRLPARIQF